MQSPQQPKTAVAAFIRKNIKTGRVVVRKRGAFLAGKCQKPGGWKRSSVDKVKTMLYFTKAGL